MNPLRPLLLLLFFPFLLLATANGAGYRYGVSDQAFYIPAVRRAADPAMFPRDAGLIDAQARLMVLDEALAALVLATGWPLEAIFAAGYFLSLLLVWLALILIGQRLYVHGWTTVALAAAITLRHRITRTSANSLEPYFHPRLLAFGVCALAVAAVLRQRSWSAVALVALAAIVHPTTALWFGVMIGVALTAADRRLRPVLVGAAATACLAAAWALTAGPLAGSLVVIDDSWRQVLASKDSLFPNQWPIAAWLANLGTAAIWAWAYVDRRRRGAATPQDGGLAAGGAVLVAVFLVTLPLVAAGVAFFVELQISRVFWVIDFLATVYALGAIDRVRAAPRAVRAVAAALVAFSLARGTWALTVEHPERDLFAFGLVDSPWHAAMRWVAAQPRDVHVLADPGHAWRYGTSARVSGERDVLLEDVKDSAVAIYSRDVAMRVLERARAIGDFDRLTAGHARALAARYDLDYLVTTRPLDLPVAYRNDAFTVYAIRPSTASSSRVGREERRATSPPDESRRHEPTGTNTMVRH